MNVPFFKPAVGKEEAQAVYDVVMSGHMTFGHITEEFEKKFAEYIGAPYVVMLDNCTAALTLACEYAFKDIPRIYRKNTLVQVPSLTCAATALAVLHAGLDLQLVDIRDDDSLLMKENPYYWAIPVSYAGKYCSAEKTVVEDFAHRIERNCFTGKLQGYSFYATKNLTTGEGGAIACATKKQYEWFRKARLFANSKALFEREKMYQTGDDFWWFESEFEGWKANPTDMMASMGLVQVQKVNAMNVERKRIADKYNEAFDLREDRSPWHLYPILVQERDKFMHYMREHEVFCSVHFPPLHMMKAFKKYAPETLPNTERVYKSLVSLPLYPYMPIDAQDYVIDLVLKWRKEHGV